MTNQEKRIVRDTYAQIRPIAQSLGMLFYGRLFELDPSIRPMFQHDMRLQSGKLMQVLDYTVGQLDRFDEARPMLRELGKKHATSYGVRPEHYATLRKAFIWSIGQALEDQFYPDVKAAWLAVIDEISAEMQKL